jgi:hypothetical protein
MTKLTQEQRQTIEDAFNSFPNESNKRHEAVMKVAQEHSTDAP